MQSKRINPPPLTALAIHSPAGGLHGHEGALKECGSFWRNQLAVSLDEIQPALYDIASSIIGQLKEGKAMWRNAEHSPATAEYGRRLLLGTVAVGLFLKEQWGEKMQPTDGLGTGRAQTLIDFCGSTNLPKQGNDFRVHTPPLQEGAPATDQWYRTPELYIHQVRPAKPSQGMQDLVAAHTIQVDFSSLDFIPLPTGE